MARTSHLGAQDTTGHQLRWLVYASIGCCLPQQLLGTTLLRRVLSGPRCLRQHSLSFLVAVAGAGQQQLQQDSWSPNRHGATAAAGPRRPAECPRHPRGARPSWTAAGMKGPARRALQPPMAAHGATVGKAYESWQMVVLPPGPLASISASFQIQYPHLNNGFCPGAWGQGGRG